MATDPRQGFDPTDVFSDISAHFKGLIALLEKQVEEIETQPASDSDALLRLQRALNAARRGAQRASELNKLDGHALGRWR